jgi:hypothetical protein
MRPTGVEQIVNGQPCVVYHGWSPAAPPQPAPQLKQQPPCLHLGKLTTEIFPPAAGLGDMLSTGLAAIGLTKERWASLWAETTEEVDCTGCHGRQKFVNALGEKIGLPTGQGGELQKLVQLEMIGPQQVRDCKIHEKCLPQLKLSDSSKVIIESAGWHLCYKCSDFKPLI